MPSDHSIYRLNVLCSLTYREFVVMISVDEMRLYNIVQIYKEN